MHFDFNNPFIKVKRTLTKISKITKKLFCFVLISGITNLYVKRIPDNKKVLFYLIKIRTSLLRRAFLEF